MPEKKCPCGLDAYAKGMCRTHYARMTRGGDPRWDVPIGEIPKKKEGAPPPCSVPECSAPRRNHTNDYCHMHYNRLRRTGTTDDPVINLVCTDPEGCENPHFAKGLCTKHYARTKSRERRLQYVFKMTEADWEALFDSQGRRCPVCLQDAPPENWASGWHVHHDHACCPGDRTCGECVVAILCGACNVGMGMLRDDPARLERAAALMRRRSFV